MQLFSSSHTVYDDATIDYSFLRTIRVVIFCFRHAGLNTGLNRTGLLDTRYGHSSLSIDEIAEAFVNDLNAGDYGSARGYLNPLFKAEIFADKLETEWQTELQSYGKFQDVVDVKVKPGSTFGAPDVAIVTLEFENQTRDYFFFFDNNRKIVNVDFVVD